MPENMTWITQHKTYHAQPEKNTSMSTFIIQKDNVLRGFLFNYSEQNKLVEQADAVNLAQLDVDARIDAISSAKPIYQIEAALPGSKIRYCGQSLWGTTTL